MAKPGELTPKQAAFVREYLVDLNASAAARRAGYSPASADISGQKNMANGIIAAAIHKAMKERSERTGITADRVLNELALLGFSNMLDYIEITPGGDASVNLATLTRDQAAAISELTSETYTDGRGEDARDVKKVKLKLSDKRANLELLGKHVGLFTDKQELTGELTIRLLREGGA